MDSFPTIPSTYNNNSNIPNSTGSGTYTPPTVDVPDYGKTTYIPPTMIIDENGDLIFDPYAFDGLQQSFLNGNPAINAQIYAYLQNHITINDRIFIKQVIDRMIQNPGLNIDIEKSTKSPFFVDLSAVSDGSTPEKVKFNKTYEALTNSPKFKELFLSIFDGDPTKANVKFVIGPTISNANGSTQITSINPLNNTITINPAYISSSNNILIAKTIIHECIHAFLNYKIFNNNSGMSIPMLNNFDVTNCINQFYNSFNGNQDQHNFIYNFMLPTFQNILSEIKDNLISPQVNLQMQNVTMHFPLPTSPSTQWNWNDFYFNLPLGGLEDCQTFQNEIGTIDNNGNVITTINSVKMNTFLTYFYFGQIYLQP
jgi:hypothetical protein